MNVQELNKLLATSAGVFCIIFAIVALFRQLKATGTIDISGIAKGKLKTGSAGIALLFFGTFILITVVIHGQSSFEESTTDVLKSPAEAPLPSFAMDVSWDTDANLELGNKAAVYLWEVRTPPAAARESANGEIMQRSHVIKTYRNWNSRSYREANPRGYTSAVRSNTNNSDGISTQLLNVVKPVMDLIGADLP